MTVEIRELIIRAVVGGEGAGGDGKSESDSESVEEAVEQTMDVLEKRKER